MFPTLHIFCTSTKPIKHPQMLDYEWGNPSPIILTTTSSATTTEPTSQPDPTRHIFDHFPPPFTEPTNTHYLNPYHDPTHHYLSDPTHFAPFYDPRTYSTYSAYTPLEPDQCYNNNINRYNNTMLMPKTEPAGFGDVTPSSPANRIGLNLGGRTYFSSAEDEFVNRLYNCRSGPVEPVHVSSVRCQAEGCNADLTNAKHYHRRHKVCEFHSKASTVVTGGLTQRFCQQCSRFHLLSEFDNGKRSCRRRLADHNRRRRKSSQNQDHSKSLVTVASTQSLSSEITSRYEPD